MSTRKVPPTDVRQGSRVGIHVRSFASLLLPALFSGCATSKPSICVGPKPSTVVESLTDPGDFNFVVVVPRRGKGAGGWQAACVPFHLKRDTGELFICRLGVEMPIANDTVTVSIPLARRVASDCANLAAQGVFSSATPATDLRSACEAFRVAYDSTLRAAIGGARVNKACNEKAERALERAGGL